MPPSNFCRTTRTFSNPNSRAKPGQHVRGLDEGRRAHDAVVGSQQPDIIIGPVPGDLVLQEAGELFGNEWAFLGHEGSRRTDSQKGRCRETHSITRLLHD